MTMETLIQNTDIKTIQIIIPIIQTIQIIMFPETYYTLLLTIGSIQYTDIKTIQIIIPIIHMGVS